MSWTLGPLKPCLSREEVHIWSIFLPNFSQTQKDAYQCLLSAEEQQRFNRFYFKPDKERFLIARAGLKAILARYQGLKASQINIEQDEWGKPYLKNAELYFNISHSKDWVLLAFARFPELGIDIEYRKPKLNFLGLAQQFCSEPDILKLSSLSNEALNLAFYRCWTRKEAFVKALGRGLHFSLDKIEVSFLENEQAKIQHIVEGNLEKPWGDPKYWKLEEINLGSIEASKEYMAALAVPNPAQIKSGWVWDGTV